MGLWNKRCRQGIHDHEREIWELAIKKVVLLSAVGAVALAAVLAFAVVLSASGNDGEMQPFDGMIGMMEGDGRMQMPVSKDVIMMLESEYELPAGTQSEVSIKVLDKQTNEPMPGARVIIGIEKGLPMTTMDMAGGGMFDVSERGNGTYTFPFTPESKGYYTIHAHVIPPGKQMHSMMENHADLVIVSK
jgi:hypothetical protein